MEGALSLIGLAAAALLVVAVAVAWWEYSVTAPRPAPPARPQHAASVDVHLDHLLEASGDPAPPDGDQVKRGAVLGGALARMAQPRPSSLAWMDTQPTIAPGTGKATPARNRASARRRADEDASPTLS